MLTRTVRLHPHVAFRVPQYIVAAPVSMCGRVPASPPRLLLLCNPTSSPGGAPMCACGTFFCVRLLTEGLTLPGGGAVMSHGTFTCRTPRTAVCTAIANRTNAQCLWWQRLRRTTGQSSGCAQRPDGL